ncbi:long-chain fatty acid--CoA ligase [Solirubrobacter ginsenosidimutans]|uniref:Long-chain fatty acid--CoA ligase n=1 Tax=Solirubrobacter ginsenosidimutans TaxID=490573 RepID=A0A9X3MRI8_9ACTN|nr:long-chain fatty acid--CoA ligase [Solirubrobacter ginsenosidimutans]MDA0160601.1 long-chain fatty acid--CoA ligase [Solirubrobacter ginsenosidimutans]
MSSLVDYLDKGASLGRDAPCLVEGATTLTYGDVQDLSHRVAGALATSGVQPGGKVGILSSNNATAFASVFGIARLGAVWCPINPRNEADENRALLELFDCELLLFHSSYADMVAKIAEQLPALQTVVCLDQEDDFESWLNEGMPALELDPPHDLAMLVGTGGTTGLPKGVMLTARNLETMTALTLMGYPFQGRPAYLALAPLTHAAGVLCFPVLALGGKIVVMRQPDLGEFLRLVEAERITHTFLPPTLIYMLLGHENLATADLSSLQCFWYGAAPMSTARLQEAITAIGPVMAQLFGQSEAPMMVSMLPPKEHFDADGNIATHRLASAGRPAPLVQVGIMDPETGVLLPDGERGEIVVKSSLVMAGYYKNPEATAEASRFGWHHTGDVGYLDADGYLFIVDRLKDMIITGGFNVYSAEVEQALMQHPSVRDCAVVGLPDEKWGERVEAVVELKPGETAEAPDLIAFVKERIGSVKAPKRVHLTPELPRSRVGKVLKGEVRAELLH